MDLNAFKVRKGWTQAEMGAALGIATSSVGGYCSGVRKPSYEIVEKLLLLGATLEEVFSREVQDAVFKNVAGPVSPNPAVYDTPEFREGVARALEDLKAKGYI